MLSTGPFYYSIALIYLSLNKNFGQISDTHAGIGTLRQAVAVGAGNFFISFCPFFDQQLSTVKIHYSNPVITITVVNGCLELRSIGQ